MIRATLQLRHIIMLNILKYHLKHTENNNTVTILFLFQIHIQYPSHL